MRDVEINVRDRARARQADLGVALMKSAFGEDGPLSDPQLERDEQQAKMALYWGAIGMFKNPSSHRQVDFDDPTLASEVILLADLLLRLLDRSSRDCSNGDRLPLARSSVLAAPPVPLRLTGADQPPPGEVLLPRGARYWCSSVAALPAGRRICLRSETKPHRPAAVRRAA